MPRLYKLSTMLTITFLLAALPNMTNNPKSKRQSRFKPPGQKQERIELFYSRFAQVAQSLVRSHAELLLPNAHSFLSLGRSSELTSTPVSAHSLSQPMQGVIRRELPDQYTGGMLTSTRTTWWILWEWRRELVVLQLIASLTSRNSRRSITPKSCRRQASVSPSQSEAAQSASQWVFYATAKVIEPLLQGHIERTAPVLIEWWNITDTLLPNAAIRTTL